MVSTWCFLPRAGPRESTLSDGGARTSFGWSVCQFRRLPERRHRATCVRARGTEDETARTARRRTGFGQGGAAAGRHRGRPPGRERSVVVEAGIPQGMLDRELGLHRTKWQGQPGREEGVDGWLERAVSGKRCACAFVERHGGCSLLRQGGFRGSSRSGRPRKYGRSRYQVSSVGSRDGRYFGVGCRSVRARLEGEGFVFHHLSSG